MTLRLGSVSFDFQDRVAIVTGAGRGIGRAVTEALLKADARVVAVTQTACSAESLRLLDPGQEKLVFIEGDASDQRVAQRAITVALERFERLDILVNNVGIVLKRKPLADWSADEWDLVQAVNLRSAFTFCQAAEPALGEASPGYVVNVASLSSFLGHWSAAAYAASKGGLAQLTKSLANEWAARGINVNAVAPGFVETDANAELRGDAILRDRMTARIPAGRWARPDDLVGPILFLCSPAAAYIHGVVLPVDGGVLAA